MGKYIFNKDYETQIRVSIEGNPNATGTKQVKIPKNTIVEGKLVEGSELISLTYDGKSLMVDKSNLSDYKPYDGSGINPNGIYTVKDDNKGTVAVKTNDATKGSVKKVSNSIFTTKNVIIGLLVIGGTIYFLKHKNII